MKLKNSYWRWFSVYLVFIFLQEFYYTIYNSSTLFGLSKTTYYGYIGIPVQYLFFYWLYALKSLKKRYLFICICSLYLLTYIPMRLLYGETDFVYPINLTVGTILLTSLVILEYLKQIRNDAILRFKTHKMFYINLGVILFYIGTYPLFAFPDEFRNPINKTLGNAYYLYFLFSNYAMYLLFTISFIWGKHPLK
ncbi:hypothetical protein ACJD0Z_08295 [Flavobacteriaceae bacterium M23B6Z8]